MSVRKFPFPKHPTRGSLAFCQWCGEGPILHYGGKRKGEPNTRRAWHDGREDEPDCLHEYYLHTRRDVQFRFVAERDGLKCCDCGASPEKWVRGPETSQPIYRDHPKWESGLSYIARYTIVERRTALELEHDIPLWLTTHLPDEERRRYFGPTNLLLRCRVCHSKKSAREAADRAKTNRLKAKAEGKAKPKRKLARRGFNKTLRRRMNGTVERR